MQPYGDKALISYFTAQPGAKVGQETVQHRIVEKSGRFQHNDNLMAYEIPEKVNRLLLVSDVHANTATVPNLGSDYDLMLASGDLTNSGY